MWGSGHYNIGSAIFASKLLFARLTGSLALNYGEFFWIDLLEKGRLQLKVTEVKKRNLKKGTKDNRRYGRLELPEGLRRKEETRGPIISTGVEENICVTSVRRD